MQRKRAPSHGRAAGRGRSRASIDLTCARRRRGRRDMSGRRLAHGIPHPYLRRRPASFGGSARGAREFTPPRRPLGCDCLGGIGSTTSVSIFRRRAELSDVNVPTGWESTEEWYAWEPPRNLVAGESYRQKELRKVAGIRNLRAGGVVVPVEVCFVREPNNEYDRNAFRAEINGQLIGYLRREAAEQIAPTLDRARCARFTVAGVLRGGSVETPTVGCHVWLTRRTSPGPAITLPDQSWIVPWPPSGTCTADES
jgi:HIRAN domain